jgi:small GTP-binding protein
MLPIVAIVGRPNVGKSTLFNRLLGQRRAIVDELPGLTRDRHYAEAEWNGHKFLLVDTGGIDPGSAHPIQRQILIQTAHALDEADVSLLVVDATQGITALDREVADRVRRRGRPMLLIVNKADTASREDDLTEFYSLGIGNPMPVSALHGRNSGDLLEEVVARLPSREPLAESADTIRIAVLGRPNVGKSSLVNRLLGSERMVVDSVAGTTRDAVDTTLKNPATSAGRMFQSVGHQTASAVAEINPFADGADSRLQRVDAALERAQELEAQAREEAENAKERAEAAAKVQADGDKQIDAARDEGERKVADVVAEAEREADEYVGAKRTRAQEIAANDVATVEADVAEQIKRANNDARKAHTNAEQAIERARDQMKQARELAEAAAEAARQAADEGPRPGRTPV